MPLRYPRAFTGLLVAIDGLLILGLYHAVAQLLRAREFPRLFVFLDPSNSYTQGLLICTAGWFVASAFAGLYAHSRSLSLKEQVIAVAKAGTLGIALIIVAFNMLWAQTLPRSVFVAFWFGSVALLSLNRVLIFTVLHIGRRNTHNMRHVLVVGANGRAANLCRAIQERPELGLKVTGYVDDPPQGRENPMTGRFPHLGGIDDFPDVVTRRVVDEVHFALPLRSQYGRIREMVDQCEDLGIETKVLFDCFETRLSKCEVNLLDGIPLLSLTPSPGRVETLLIKRALDIVGAALALVFAAPLMAVIALLVKFTSPGPVLYRQVRVGYHNRRFTLLKFRTMRVDADEMRSRLEDRNEMDGPVFKIKNDPRLTPIGRWLRAYSLDELPQLWNVLRGSMSLVGPRPPLPKEVERYELPQRRRLSMSPGLTGLWQVTGRNSVPFKKWVEMDLEYIDSWSLFLDCRILAKTIPAVLSGKGM